MERGRGKRTKRPVRGKKRKGIFTGKHMVPYALGSQDPDYMIRVEGTTIDEQGSYSMQGTIVGKHDSDIILFYPTNSDIPIYFQRPEDHTIQRGQIIATVKAHKRTPGISPISPMTGVEKAIEKVRITTKMEKVFLKKGSVTFEPIKVVGTSKELPLHLIGQTPPSLEEQIIEFITNEVIRIISTTKNPTKIKVNPFQKEPNEMEKELIPMLAEVFKNPQHVKRWLLSHPQPLEGKRPVDFLPDNPNTAIDELYALVEGVHS